MSRTLTPGPRSDFDDLKASPWLQPARMFAATVWSAILLSGAIAVALVVLKFAGRGVPREAWYLPASLAGVLGAIAGVVARYEKWRGSRHEAERQGSPVESGARPEVP